jgi:FAD-dependent oxidoreductase domain-containing protein 1
VSIFFRCARQCPMRALPRAVYDVVVVGGGAIGSSVAYHLARAGVPKVLVVERDPTYSRASSTLSAGGIRQQFSIPENVRMSMYGAEFLHGIRQLEAEAGDVVDVQFREQGYLFLATDAGRDALEGNYATQRRCGADWIHLLNREALGQRFPWLDSAAITLGATSDRNEGYFDPWAFVMALRRKARALGVVYQDATAEAAEFSANGTISNLTVSSPVGTQTVAAGAFVNAAGAWAGRLTQTLAKTAPKTVSFVPIEPRKRCVFQFDVSPSPSCPPPTAPLVVLPDGVWFRPERNSFLAGVSPPNDQDPECEDTDLQNVDSGLFTDCIWPSLAASVPAFHELKVRRDWAGFYDYNTLDQNAILGPHPDIPNWYLCAGFSGHGLQHAPAAGHAIAELLVDGRFTTLDLSRLSFRRVTNGEPLVERAVV